MMNPSDTSISILPIHPPVPHLGHVLEEQGKMTADDISRALMLAKEHGMLFGEAARSLGIISAADIEQAVARQFRFRYLQPGEGDYPPELYAAYAPFGEEAESLRGLRAQLLEHWFDQEHKVLAIAGVSESANCSMLAANLAVAFSQIDMRTLLVDANLRHPRQQDIFRREKVLGLTDILAGRTDPDRFFGIPHFNSLSILTAGTLPPNPHELLSRRAFPKLLETVSSRFDVVLVDSPAFLSANEAFTVASRAGGVLLLCPGGGRTRVSDLTGISKRIADTGARIVGSILVDE